MRHKFFTLLFAIGASIGTIFGSNTQVDGIWYNFNSSTLTAEVTYRGSSYYSYSNEYSGSVVIPSSVTYSNNTYKVTSIGENAFRKSSGLTSVTIPSTVTSIGNYAFDYCEGLTSITIPNSVKSIGNCAFYYCISLLSVTIPNSVTSIGYNAFYRVLNIVYSGTAAGSPWEAKSVNGYVDGDLVYSDNSKTTLIACLSAATEITIPNTVTSIGEKAFKECYSLTSVTIPNSVTSMGDWAFYDCTHLTAVHISDLAAWFAISFGNSDANPLYYANQLYLNGVLITDLVIPNSVTSIKDYAFYFCNSLTSVSIHSNVTRIGERAFYCCIGLTSINIPNSVTSIGDGAFSGCSGLTSVVLPNTITNIGEGTFFSCKGLTSVIIPNSVTSIGNSAFRDCTGLTSIKIPNNVTSIGESAFWQCTGLTSVEIPNSVTSIGESAFRDCIGLTSVEIPNSVTSIGELAFYRVNNIVYSGSATGSPWGAKSVNGYVDGYLVFDNTAKTAILGCSTAATGEIIIPNSVTRIGDYAFCECAGLISVTIPNDVTRIGDYAFCQCTGLTSIDIPNNVTRIGEYAFYKCASMNSVTIGNSVTDIRDYAFCQCTGLDVITSYAETPPSIFSGWVFYNVNKSYCRVYVPKNSVDLYKSTYRWRDFTHIEAIVQYYTVQFFDWDNTVLSSEQVEEDTAATPPDNPTREGYTFTGWDKDFSNITENLTVTAQYSINHYQVDFLDWNGTLLKSDDVEYVSAATPPADPSRDWYTFVGWDKDFSNITSDLVVTAQYEEGQTRDNMIFFINGTDNSEISHQAIEIDFPTPPTIAGFTFLKWQVLAGDIDDGIQIQAVYTYDGEPTSAPSIVTNPSNPAQKLIRNGSVYILTDDSRTYTLSGQQVK